MRTRIKFCGCTSVDDIDMSVEAGADAVGFIFASSPRAITFEALRRMAPHLPPFIAPIGVFVNPAHEEVTRARSYVPNLIPQLSGGEGSAFCGSLGGQTIKTVHVGEQTGAVHIEAAAKEFANAVLLFDTRTQVLGGSGVTFAWEKIAGISANRSIIVGGGLTPSNVGECIRQVRPYAVDVRSGVETSGKKDPRKMRAFVQSVREADET